MTARPRTNRVRSQTERSSTWPTCGRRNGGSSCVKEEGTPRSSVRESSFVIPKVAKIPSRIMPVSMSAERTERPAPPAVPTKKMRIRLTRVGNRPLQGTKLLVRIASSRSRGESMMRQPTTPAALQPNPMQMVRACLPQAPQRFSGLSKL